MWFDQAEAKDLTLLAEYGVWGGVPAAPLCLPGLGRYGRYQFDRYVLLQRNNLTVAQRREVIFLAEHFHKIDHFEFFELNHDADERSLKRAFFRFSKRFHPDQVSAIDLGHFSEHVQMVFEYGQQAYKLLTEEPEPLTIEPIVGRASIYWTRATSSPMPSIYGVFADLDGKNGLLKLA